MDWDSYLVSSFRSAGMDLMTPTATTTALMRVLPHTLWWWRSWASKGRDTVDSTSPMRLPFPDASFPMPAPSTPPSRSYLDRLPSELIGVIADHLPLHARIALKLCSKALLQKTPLRRANDRLADCFSMCEKNALRRYRSEYKQLRDARRYCLVCHTLQDNKYMCYGDGKICSFHGVMFVHPAHRRYILGPAVSSSTYDERDFRWVWFWRQFCVHKGQVLWNTDGQACDCGCQLCGHIEVACRFRVRTRRTGEGMVLSSCSRLARMRPSLVNQCEL
nr:hypothetical protein CFP56_53295 [Quercus suber]